MSTIPTTDDTAERIAIMPDWSERMTHRAIYRTDILRSRTGLEQRAQRQRRAIQMLEYRAEMATSAARRAIEEAVRQTRKPLLVPWWSSGIPLANQMPNSGAATLDVEPIGDEWERSGWIYLWGRETGAEFRKLASRTNRNLVLTDEGGHLVFPAGDWAFPVLKAIRQRDESMLSSPRHEAQTERLTFRTL